MPSKLLELPLLEEAKICTGDCNLIASDKDVVYCVGCGRGCHLSCHKVPGTVKVTFAGIPKANRNISPHGLGDLSYIRIICDNCLHLINAEVRPGFKSCFLNLFSRIAEGQMKEKLPDTTESTSKKRKLSNVESDIEDESQLDGIKSVLDQYMKKINDDLKAAVKTTTKTALQSLKSDLSIELVSKIDSTICNSLSTNLNAGVASKLDQIETCNQKIDTVIGKLDKLNGYAINSSMKTPQREFVNVRNGSTLRHQAMVKNARKVLDEMKNDTPKTGSNDSGDPSFKVNTGHLRNRQSRKRIPNGKIMQMEAGTSDDDALFGEMVPRRLNLDSAPARREELNKFRYDEAIYLRFVNPDITPDKMLELVKRNQQAKTILEKNLSEIEITLLVKKSLTAEQVANLRNGVSYRIGASSDLFPIIRNTSMWAKHWEVRLWKADFKHKGKVVSDAASSIEIGSNQSDLDFQEMDSTAN